jgi:hypothetical protein
MQNRNLSLVHLTTLRMILGRINPYVNIFIRVANHLAVNFAEEVHICIIAGHTPGNEDVRCYNVPMANKVVMIIFGEPGEVGNRDVIIQWRYGGGL